MNRAFILILSLIALAVSVLAVQQQYPNMKGTRLLENDRVLVESFISQPGQWTGKHSHQGNQVTVILKGGTVTFREDGHQRVEKFENGQVIWVEATDGHDHGNTGSSTIEMMVFTLK